MCFLFSFCLFFGFWKQEIRLVTVMNHFIYFFFLLFFLIQSVTTTTLRSSSVIFHSTVNEKLFPFIVKNLMKNAGELNANIRDWWTSTLGILPFKFFVKICWFFIRYRKFSFLDLNKYTHTYTSCLHYFSSDSNRKLSKISKCLWHKR